MRPFFSITAICMLGFSLLLTSCEKEDTDPTQPVLTLTPDNVLGKSGRTTEATLKIYAPNGAGTLKMYKTINLQRDNSFGTNGILTATPVDLGNNNYEYTFSYQFEATEVDKLVGINFRFEDAKGKAAEKDLTVNTTTSGQQIMYSRRWNITTRMWTSISPAAEDVKACELDNIYIWRADSTYSILFGTAPCDFDGFNVFDTWELTADEKTLYQEYYSLFDPSNRTREVYTVKTLNREKIELQQTIDLTVFGLTDKETFVSSFVPAP